MMLILVLLAVFVPVLFVSWGAYHIHPLVGIIVKSILITTSFSQRLEGRGIGSI